MGNWDGMGDMEEFFSQEIQTIKDLLADSAWEVTASWPHVFWHQAMKHVTNDAGVLFKDVGRSRNPYPRTKMEQEEICAYVKVMLRLWLRVRTTVRSQDTWMHHLGEFQQSAKRLRNRRRGRCRSFFQRIQFFLDPLGKLM